MARESGYIHLVVLITAENQQRTTWRSGHDKTNVATTIPRQDNNTTRHRRTDRPAPAFIAARTFKLRRAQANRFQARTNKRGTPGRFIVPDPAAPDRFPPLNNQRLMSRACYLPHPDIPLCFNQPCRLLAHARSQPENSPFPASEQSLICGVKEKAQNLCRSWALIYRHLRQLLYFFRPLHHSNNSASAVSPSSTDIFAAKLVWAITTSASTIRRHDLSSITQS